MAASPAVCQAQLTVTNGVVLWLRADAGVTTNAADGVSIWRDQSTNGNNAGAFTDTNYVNTATTLPTLIPNAVNGKPVLYFDGVQNVLEISNSPSLQPGATGSNTWTVFLVAQRLTNSMADFPEIIGSRPWVGPADAGWSISFTGPSASPQGLVSSHLADGTSGHDVQPNKSIASMSQSGFQMWQVEENPAAGTTKYYFSDISAGAYTQAMPANPVLQTNDVYIGREIAGVNTRRANMYLAEVIIYSRVLSTSEQQAVATYLSGKYSLTYPYLPPTVSLVSPTNGTKLAFPTSFNMAATVNAGSVPIRNVIFYLNSNIIATATPPYATVVSVQSPGTFILTAVASDINGILSTPSAVTITATGTYPTPPLSVSNGLVLWLEGNAGLTTNAAGGVSTWADQSGNGNNAVQDNSGAGSGQNFQPSATNAPNGLPLIHFNGILNGSFLDIANSASLQPQGNDWTVLLVAQRHTPSVGDFPEIIGSRPWTANLDVGWAVCFQNSSGQVTSHYADGVNGHDASSAFSATALSTSDLQVWQVEEARSTGFTTFYLQKQTNQSLATPMPLASIDQPEDIIIGADVYGADNRYANIDIGEILVFNRVLSASERGSIDDYLLGKWAVPQISPSNTPPTITLISPTNGQSLVAPATITLTANAASAAGNIVQVQFFVGTTSLGVATNSPYTITTTLTGVGNQTITAVATDNLGNQTTSTAANVTVFGPNALLIGTVDYSDTFTTNALRPDGLYNSANSAYSVENTHGHPSASWIPTTSFSFNTPQSSTAPTVLEAAQNNPGAATGFAQSGGGDASFTYGLRSNYIVQVEAILPTDHLDITSLPVAGGGIGSSNSLTVLIRRPTSSTGHIGLYNGKTETMVTNLLGTVISTQITDNNWHNFAVSFNQTLNQLQIYVDGVELVSLDLTVFAGGLYQSYSGGAVGIGGSGGVFWMDSFQVGAAAPFSSVAASDYSETFTTTAVRTVGLLSDNSRGAYQVENSYTNPPSTWTPTSGFGFEVPSAASDNKVAAATNDPGAATGIAQGYGDFSFAYGLRSDYVLQADAILSSDRIDFTSCPAPGAGIFGNNRLSVFFRLDTQPSLPPIGLFNGSVETAVTAQSQASNGTPTLVLTGVTDFTNWHHYAVEFNQNNQTVSMYVDGRFLQTVDLTTFAGGIYANYSNGAVGVGGNNTFWFDNITVGGPQTLVVNRTSLSAALQGTHIVVSWTGGGTLQSAPTVIGPWTTLTNAVSGYSVATAGGAQFYRLHIP